jgi:sarcosine oxidase subunit beta
MSSSKSYDAIIIGAGVIGASVAFEMAKKGWKTLSIDKGPEAGYGSTSGSCAIIRTHYSTPQSCALAYESWHYWDKWDDYLGVTDEHGMVEYKNTGCIVMKSHHNNNLKVVCDTMEELGCPFEPIDADEVSKRVPGTDLRKFDPAKSIEDDAFGEPTGGELEGGVFFPLAGYVSDPKLSAHNVQRAAEAHGSEFMFNSEIVEIRKENGRVAGVVLKDGAQINSSVVINVGGPHSSIINRMAGVEEGMNISTRALRHEVAHVPAPADIDFGNGGFVLSDSDISCYSRSEVGNNILIGSEDPPCDEKEWVDDPDDYNTEFTNQNKTLAMRLAQRMPELRIPEQALGVVALYDVADDWMPIYDKSDLPGFYMACGTSGNQYKNAPVAGKIMATIVEACEAGRDHDEDPITFKLEHIGYDLPLSTFSRKREINPDSSFSVIG